jgi:DNA repair protein RecO (recombination protein O)
MEDTRATDAIILRRQPYREADSRVWIYSRDFGKLELIARGTQKPGSKLAGHLEPFTETRMMVVFGKKQSYVGSAINSNSYHKLKSELSKLHFAGQAIQAFDKLIKPGIDDQELYNLLSSFLGAVNDLELKSIESWRNSSLYHLFILKFLAKLGYEPNLSECVIGRHPLVQDGNYFDFGRGALVCVNCRKVDKANDDYRHDQWLKLSDACREAIRSAIKDDFGMLLSERYDSSLDAELGIFAKTYLHWQGY